MMTPVPITQSQEDDSLFLTNKIRDLKLKAPISTVTASPSSGLHVSCAANFKTTTMPYLNTDLVVSTTKFSPESVGSTSSTVTGGFSYTNHPTDLFPDQWVCYRAQHYYETMCDKNPQYLLVMAYGIINPETGFPFSFDREPFISYHKKSELKIGNNHLRCEVVRRARLNPNWVGVRWGNNALPKPLSWSKPKCLEWLMHNPIQNDEDYQYIVDTVFKLIRFVSSSNQKHGSLPKNLISEKETITDTSQIEDLQFNPIAPMSSVITTPGKIPGFPKMGCSDVLSPPSRFNESNSSQNRVKNVTKRTGLMVKSVSKRSGLMDPATFKLLLEHQKEYSVPTDEYQSQDPATMAGKKQWNTFWTKCTKKPKKKKRNVKFVWQKKEEAVLKAKVDFLDRIHDLNTPMLLSDMANEG